MTYKTALEVQWLLLLQLKRTEEYKYFITGKLKSLDRLNSTKFVLKHITKLSKVKEKLIRTSR